MVVTIDHEDVVCCALDLFLIKRFVELYCGYSYKTGGLTVEYFA